MRVTVYWYTTTGHELVTVDVTTPSHSLEEQTTWTLGNSQVPVMLGSHTLFVGGTPSSDNLYVALRWTNSGVEFVRASVHDFDVTEPSVRVFRTSLHNARTSTDTTTTTVRTSTDDSSVRVAMSNH